jgi:hypothetical protein
MEICMYPTIPFLVRNEQIRCSVIAPEYVYRFVILHRLHEVRNGNINCEQRKWVN